MVARVVLNIATDNVAVGQEFYTDVLGCVTEFSSGPSLDPVGGRAIFGVFEAARGAWP